MLPYLSANENKEVQLLKFKGLDLRHKADPETLSQEKNMSADSYPALTPRKARKTVIATDGITAITAPEYTDDVLTEFTGIKNSQFYYKGTQISGTLTNGEKSIADFNGKICIFPDKVYYDYLEDSKTLESMEKSLSVSGAKFYSSLDDMTGAYTAYISKTGGGFDTFKAGDSLIIEGCSKSQNNIRILQSKHDFASDTAIVSVIVTEATANRLDLLLYNKNGEKALFTNTTESGEITVKVSIPDMNHVCVHNNRLWGTASNGEYIYASKLGDCLNFNSFQGLSDDSWYSMIGTSGKFTGICSYRSAVVAFKRQCIHHIYGDSPTNFSIPKQTMGGCIDGRSIAELGGILYYLSRGEFCAYNGGEPYVVSPQLPVSYTACVSGTDGQRYYAAAYKADGSCDVLVYDPDLNLWHREDDTPFTGFIQYGTRLYGATTDAVFEFGTGEDLVDWSFTTQPLTYNDSRHKGVNCLWLRADTEADAKIKVSISHDNGEFVSCAVLPREYSYRNHRIPIRFKKCDSFKIRVEGSGKAVIHDLELVTYQGGKTYGI